MVLLMLVARYVHENTFNKVGKVGGRYHINPKGKGNEKEIHSNEAGRMSVTTTAAH